MNLSFLQFTVMQGALTSFKDAYPSLQTKACQLAFGTCLFLFVMGLPMTCQVGKILSTPFIPYCTHNASLRKVGRRGLTCTFILYRNTLAKHFHRCAFQYKIPSC